MATICSDLLFKQYEKLGLTKQESESIVNMILEYTSEAPNDITGIDEALRKALRDSSSNFTSGLMQKVRNIQHSISAIDLMDKHIKIDEATGLVKNPKEVKQVLLDQYLGKADARQSTLTRAYIGEALRTLEANKLMNIYRDVQYSDAIYRAFKGVDTGLKGEMKEAVEQIAAIFRNRFDLIRSDYKRAGFKIGFRENYIPHIWDKTKIVGTDISTFIEDFKRLVVHPEGVTDEFIKTRAKTFYANYDHLGDMPNIDRAPSELLVKKQTEARTKVRTVEFKSVEAELEFIDKYAKYNDFADMTSMYMDTSAKNLAITSTLGPNPEKVSNFIVNNFAEKVGGDNAHLARALDDELETGVAKLTGKWAASRPHKAIGFLDELRKLTTKMVLGSSAFAQLQDISSVGTVLSRVLGTSNVEQVFKSTADYFTAASKLEKEFLIGMMDDFNTGMLYDAFEYGGSKSGSKISQFGDFILNTTGMNYLNRNAKKVVGMNMFRHLMKVSKGEHASKEFLSTMMKYGITPEDVSTVFPLLEANNWRVGDMLNNVGTYDIPKNRMGVHTSEYIRAVAMNVQDMVQDVADDAVYKMGSYHKGDVPLASPLLRLAASRKWTGDLGEDALTLAIKSATAFMHIKTMIFDRSLKLMKDKNYAALATFLTSSSVFAGMGTYLKRELYHKEAEKKKDWFNYFQLLQDDPKELTDFTMRTLLSNPMISLIAEGAYKGATKDGKPVFGFGIGNLQSPFLNLLNETATAGFNYGALKAFDGYTFTKDESEKMLRDIGRVGEKFLPTNHVFFNTLMIPVFGMQKNLHDNLLEQSFE